MTQNKTAKSPVTSLKLPLILILLASAFAPLATDIFIPALPQIEHYFKTDTATVQLTLSLALYAFALSHLFYGPISDRFGRRPVLLVGMAIFTVGTFLCYRAITIEMLIVARIIQAIGACSGQVIGRAMIRDIYGAKGSHRYFAYAFMMVGLIAIINPIIGGFLAHYYGWRSVFMVLFIMVVVICTISVFKIEESLKIKDHTAIHPLIMLRNMGEILKNKVFISFALLNSLVFISIFIHISLSTAVFQDEFSLTSFQYSFCYAFTMGCFFIGSYISARLSGIYRFHRLIFIGGLISLCATGGGTFIAFMVCGTVFEGNFWFILVPLCACMIGNGLIAPVGEAGGLAPFGEKAGLASALMGAIRFSAGATVTLCLAPFIHYGSRSLLAAIAMASLAIVILTLFCHRRYWA